MATIDEYRKIENLAIEANEFAYDAKKNLKKAKEYFDEGVIISHEGFMCDEVVNCIKDLGDLEDRLDALNSYAATKRKVLENQISEDYVRRQQEITQKYSQGSQTGSSQTTEQTNQVQNSNRDGSSSVSDKKRLSPKKNNGMYFAEYS